MDFFFLGYIFFINMACGKLFHQFTNYLEKIIFLFFFTLFMKIYIDIIYMSGLQTVKLTPKDM